MDNDTIKQFALSGLNKLFNSPGSYYDRRIKNSFALELINTETFHVYFEHLFEGNDEFGAYWASKISETFLDELSKSDGIRPSDFWKKKFVSYSDPEYVAKAARSYVNGSAPWVDLGLKLNDSPKTFELFEIIHENISQNNWLNPRYENLVASLAEDSPLSLKLFVESNVFKKGKFDRAKPAIRGLLYKHYVEQGFLTTKTARKIRSDSSGEASHAGVVALLEGEADTYSNQEELLLCFTDSRHECVVEYLARNLPIHLISSLLGTDFTYAKSTIERRMINGE